MVSIIWSDRDLPSAVASAAAPSAGASAAPSVFASSGLSSLASFFSVSFLPMMLPKTLVLLRD